MYAVDWSMSMLPFFSQPAPIVENRRAFLRQGALFGLATTVAASRLLTFAEPTQAAPTLTRQAFRPEQATAWHSWEDLGGIITEGPAVSSWSPGRLDCFVKGSDNALWHKWYNNGWSDWESLGGTFDGQPAAVSWDFGRIDCFVRGMDNALWHKWYNNGWSNWESLGGAIDYEPAAVSWDNGRIDCFVRGMDNALWHKWYNN